MPNRTERSEEVEAARDLFGHVTAGGGVVAGAQRLRADRGWLPVLPGQVAAARGVCPARPWQPWPRCADRRPIWHHVSFEVGLCAGHGRGSPCPGNSRLRGSPGVTREGDAEIPAWSASEVE